MNAMAKKLKSRRGASILLAMFLFLVCVFVAGAVLTAAYHTAARSVTARKAQQDYLAVASAAQVLKEAVGNKRIEMTYTETTTTTKDEEGNPLGSSTSESFHKGSYDGVLEEIGTGAYGIFKDNKTPDAANLAFSVADHPEFENVEGTLAMEGGYTVTIKLQNKDGGNPMTLSFPATTKNNSTSSSGGNGTTTITHTTVDTTTVTWQFGGVKGGGGT